MRLKLFVIVILSLLSIHCNAQEKDYRSRIVLGGVSGMVANEKLVYLITRRGEFCRTAADDDRWVYSKISDGVSKALCPLTDRLIIAGYDGSGKGLLLLTDDGGITWRNVDTGNPKCDYVDAAFSNGKNKIWVADNKRNIFYSADRGDSWTTLDILSPRDKANHQRVMDIYYSDDNTGWYSFIWNLIYMTTDNGKTVTRIVTPLDQKKYVKAEGSQPRIDKFRPVGNYYFVVQEDKVYTSDKDNINWQKNDSIYWFDVTSKGNMLTVSNNSYVTLLNPDLQPLWQQRLPALDAKSFAVHDENLYLLAFDGSIVVVDKDGIKETEKFSEDWKIKGCDFMAGRNGLTYGAVVDNAGRWYYHEYGDVVCRDSREGDWYRVARLNRTITHMWLNDGHLMVSDFDNNKYEVNVNDHSITLVRARQAMFEGLTVRAIRFTHASSGCFHSWSATRDYELSGDALAFKSESISLNEEKNAFKGLPKTISQSKANELLEAVAQGVISPEKEDFRVAFTEHDKADYRKLIDELTSKKDFLHGEPLAYYPKPADKEYYLSVIDSLNTLSNEDYRNIFCMENKSFCTTTDTEMVTLTLSDGSTVYIYVSGFGFNYMYCPWAVSYCGAPSVCKSLRVSRLVDEMTNGKFIGSPYNEPKFGLFKIASYLFAKYRQ